MQSVLYSEQVQENYRVDSVSLQTENNLSFYGVNFSDANASLQNLLHKSDWGPRRDPLYIVIPISIVYVATFLSGVLGNPRDIRPVAADLGASPEIYLIWSKYPYIFGEAFCVLQGFAAETSANATVLTITAFTIERYVAICHPFLSHTLSKLNRAVKYIIAIWIVAMCLAVPLAMAFGVVCEHLSNGLLVDDHCVCTVKRSVVPHAFEISTFVFFVAPMSLITVLYILIGLQLHRSTVGPSRGNSVKMKHRVYKPVSNNATPSNQAVAALNGEDENLQKNALQEEEEGRKNFAKNAQATKHVVKMLGK
ncbi:hypothetical protein NQ318_016653 [Aromia moschata]|uniref:G-protein coupled receptors family 1 profile domain-containing protein n=1 Tax=Aromia moschata TaxID=1265417 RepID=A0AAV8X1E8_9CUCU|nr:hypothetical protein NQ318_016653 [Aromia moschata]